MHRALCLELSQMGSDGHGGAKEGGERGLKLFGVRIMGERGCGEEEEEEVMRKSASMGNLVSCEAGAGAEHGSELGYLSDGGLVGAARRRRGGQERKRGVPWTEEEHKTFLAGLKKLGKGDWRGISRNFVPTRTPTQVASHAQKYFLRQSNPSKKKRRSSLFDVVIDETAIVAETDPTLSSKKALEATKETDHLCKDNHLVGIPSFNTMQSVSGGAMASQASPMTTTCSNAPNVRSLNFMAGIAGPTKGPKIPSLVWAFSITEHGAPPFGADSAAVVPDFLKLSLTHPHRPAQSSAASAAFVESSDLDLSIGPPRPHSLAQLSSSPREAGAIRVV